MSAADTTRRLVEDVQQLGLHSASAVMGRYAQAVEEALGLDHPPRAASPPDAGTIIDDAARLAGAYLGFLDGLAGLVDRRSRPDARLETVHLPATPPGATSRVSVWVHNGTGEPVVGTVRVGPLVSAEGSELPVGAATVEPSSVTVPAGGRAEVVLRVDVPAGQRPGTYVGVGLSPGAAPVALSLDVVEEGSP